MAPKKGGKPQNEPRCSNCGGKGHAENSSACPFRVMDANPRQCLIVAMQDVCKETLRGLHAKLEKGAISPAVVDAFLAERVEVFTNTLLFLKAHPPPAEPRATELDALV